MEMTLSNAIKEAREKGFIVVLETITEDDYDLEDFVFSVYKKEEIIYGYVNYDTLRAFLFGLYAPSHKED